jgi:signal transduction histidine kinase
MRDLRWWHAAVVATVAALTATLAIQGPQPRAWIGGITSMAVLLAGWSVFSRTARTDRTAALLLIAVVILSTGAATSFSPFLATLQCIAYPIVWTFAGGLRPALVGNVLLVVSVGVGFLVAGGTGGNALAQAAIICALSLGMSLGIGLWFTSVYAGLAERQRLIDQLQSAQARLETLSRAAGTTSERERLVRELHDTIAQDLAGLVLTAQRGRRELADGDVAAAADRLEVLEENARHALTETRTLVASGTATGVDGRGLPDALRRLGERSGRETGIAISVTVSEAAKLDRANEVVLLRCVQEALANVRNHSAASSASVVVDVHGHEVELRVTDDGRGFDSASATSGFGLGGMRERLALANGRLAVTSRPGSGTTLVAFLPASGAVGA